MEYYKNLKALAKAEGKQIKDYLPISGHNTRPALYRSLKHNRPDMLKKVLHPFEMLGGKVEIKITASNGKIFYL